MMKTYALVGRSGTGKSFRAQSVANKYHISLIIDDGLLIKKDVILAGRSAKQDPSFLSAVKTALFQDREHYESVLTALQKEKFRKILILGTSEKMVYRIAERLSLAPPSTIIYIEDIASQDEIDTALRVRLIEGRHVIPVPSLQVTRSYSSIVYDSIKIVIKKAFMPFFPFLKKRKQTENTLVKPVFSKTDDTIKVSDAALMQMISQCLYDYRNTIKVDHASYTLADGLYTLNAQLRTPEKVSAEMEEDLKEYIIDSLEKYGGLVIDSIKMKIVSWD